MATLDCARATYSHIAGIGFSQSHPTHYQEGQSLDSDLQFRPWDTVTASPSVECLVSILQQCRGKKSLLCSKHAHLEVCHHGLESHEVLGNHIVPMFIECGSVPDAQRAFNQLDHQNEHSWSSLIHGYVESEHLEHALTLFYKMQSAQVSCHKKVLIGLLRACIMQRSVHIGLTIHLEVAKEGYEEDVFMGNALLNMYGKSGLFDEAHEVFDQLSVQDVISWTTLIGAYAEHGLGMQALHYLELMQLKGIAPNIGTCVCSLQACSSIQDIDRGWVLHSSIIKAGFEGDNFVGNSLVGMYAKCSSLPEAQDVFEKLLDRDLVSWNALITGYADNGFYEEALLFFEYMKVEGFSPNHITLVSCLKVCASMGLIEKGCAFFLDIVEDGFESDQLVGGALVGMYAKWGLLKEAHQIFEDLRAHSLVSWTALISGYAQHGYGEEALHCLDQMKLEGVSPDVATYICILKALGNLDFMQQVHEEIIKVGFEADLLVSNTLIDIYAIHGLLADSRKVLNGLPIRNIYTWTSMIAGYVDCGFDGEALICLYEMQAEEVLPNAVTFCCFLKACGNIGSVDKGQKVHTQIVKEGLERGLSGYRMPLNRYACHGKFKLNQADEPELTGIALYNALVDMYGKCGSMAEAHKVFDAMVNRDIITWNALIAGYARQGKTEVVFNIFERLSREGFCPDEITFISVLSVCSHAGLLNRGLDYFHMMNEEFDIIPLLEHENCVVDLLGRAGQLDTALALAKKISSQSDLVTWTALLGACHRWRDAKVFEAMLK